MRSRVPESPRLEALLAVARRHVMTDEEREAQRQSWVRGERAMGNDADEAKWRASMRTFRILGWDLT